MNPTQHSLDIARDISTKINNLTFHHHYHIIYDVLCSYNKFNVVNYVEIGCYGGGSACLALQRPNTNVISIDLGDPIPKNIVIENTTKLNIHNNKYTYLQGNSQTYEMVSMLKQEIDSIDLLFIDGDHFYQGVINDFMLYNDIVNQGGYILFDDYNDVEYSPEVKLAVDDIIKSHADKFRIIGTLPNNLGARPESMQEGNVFILQKL
jgi:predicted O-methyltransferase YrrM